MPTDPLLGDLNAAPDPGEIHVEMTADERDLAVSALQFASTYACEPNLAADALARKLQEAH